MLPRFPLCDLYQKEYGEPICHNFSGINRIEEIGAAIDPYVYEGLITMSERETLFTEIRDILNLEPMKELFSQGWVVRSEREILLPGGEILRPDRVVSRGNEAVVIDFKTGKILLSHETQVKRYGSTLLEMGFTNVRHYLVYIALKQVKEVN